MKAYKYILPCLVCVAALAQNSESLLIGAGDQLHVQVFDSPELEQLGRVTDDGNLQLIMGGKVKVAGLTPGEAARTIEGVLVTDHILLKPHVLVTVAEYATQKVSVLGEVRLPGAYSIETPRSVLDVLSLAGGLTELADRKIIIERKGTKEQIHYFVSNEAGVSLDTAVKVSPGDTIIVPRAGIVYVLGDVKAPGGYTMTNNEGQLSVLQLVARAGGTNHTAAPSHTKLMRKTADGYVEMALPLSEMQKGKRADMALQASDIIYVPFSYTRNFVVGGAGIASAAASAAVYRF